jgi:flagellar hook-associated protein 1
MSLALSLNNALSGLNVNRQSLAVLSQNISNANTPGYSRKVINQESLYLDGLGAGVSIKDVGRKVDDYLIRASRIQSAKVGQTGVVSDYYDRIQILIGKPGGQNSINSDINTFFNSLQYLANSPENVSLRTNVVETGSTLARNISDLSNNLNELRFQADQDIVSSIKTINYDLREISKLNATINTDQSLGKSVAELQDKRDTLIKDLSQYLDIVTYTKPTGELNITTNSGVSLLDENLYELSYSATGSVETFSNNTSLSSIVVNRLDSAGKPLGAPRELVSSGTAGNIISGVSSGKLRGLIELRDSNIPDMLSQLDILAANMRDEVNAVHNQGTGFPGANAYTGTRAVGANDFSQWSGSIRLAVLDKDGLPLSSSYPNEKGTPAFTLDLSTLSSGTGMGQPSVQAIVDEINSYYAPQDKVQLGNLSNIRIASLTNALPAYPAEFNFDFDLENQSELKSNFFITGMQLFDNNDIAMANPTMNLPTLPLAGTYTTTAGSTTIRVNTTTPPTLSSGDYVFMSTPGAAIDGIDPSYFNKYFKVTNVTNTGYDIVVDQPASLGGTHTVGGVTAYPSYQSADAGSVVRTGSKGSITADLSGNTAAPFYTIKATVGVVDAEGNVSTSVVTYRINNNVPNMLNDRFIAIDATGAAEIINPVERTPALRALMVDANGNELPKINGVYTSNQLGYLRIESPRDGGYVVIDSLDSVEKGRPNDRDAAPATTRGFAHYFEMNNFFARNLNADNGIAAGSARDLKVEARLITNPNLVALGRLVPVSDTTKYAKGNYQRNLVDDSIVQKLSALSTKSVAYSAVGGLGEVKQTFAGYAGQVIGAAATVANAASNENANAQSLLDGFAQRSDSVSGVNLDEELANTIIYQNAYSASARIITVVDELFDTLIQSFG